MIKSLAVLSFYILTAQVMAAPAPLSLDNYLEQIKAHDTGYQAAQASEQAAKSYADEGRLVSRPVLFSNWRYSDDAKPFAFSSPAFSYNTLLQKTAELGVSEKTTFGLDAKFSYAIVGTEYQGLSSPYYEGRPMIELSQALWRNDFGRETRADIEGKVEGARAKAYSAGFERQSLLVNGENAYWRLALARENQGLAKENLDRAQKLYDWAAKRVRLSLAERSDLLQATTLLQTRKLELLQSNDEVRGASQNFNAARSVNGDSVAETLNELSRDVVANLKVPERGHERFDILAAKSKAKAQQAAAILAREKNQPVLDLFGTYAFNSRNGAEGDAFERSWTNSRPTQVVGVRFSTPLDFGTMSDVQSGYAQEAKASELIVQRKQYEQEQEWADLNRRFLEARERLKLVEGLELAQKEKLNYERDRHMRGRTTLFQVLTFESEYIVAQQKRVQTLADLLQTATKMKLYGVKYESR